MKLIKSHLFQIKINEMELHPIENNHRAYLFLQIVEVKNHKIEFFYIKTH